VVVMVVVMMMVVMPAVGRSRGRDGEGQAKHGGDGDQRFTHFSVSSLVRSPADDVSL